MNSLSFQQQQKAERLTDAFRLFNELSANLTHSYQGLEEQIARLNRELAAARDERLRTLVEKERLASRLQQILAALPAAVVVLNAQGVVVDCNNHALDFLGEPLLGQFWSDVVGRSLQPVFESPHERQLRDGRKVNITHNVLGNDAEQVILLSDVSEIRSLQETLVQQKQLSAMGEMVAGLAHQVRTPLATAILYASQMNRPGIADDKRRQFSAKILERLHYLERQVNDMLIFAKQGRMAMQGFSLNRLMAHLREAKDGFSGELDIDNSVGDLLLFGNQDALRGALLNLINNAAEAGARKISVRATVGVGGIAISVADDGPGIAPEQRAKLFEPFFTTKSNGTGLGLAVVESVARAHGGTVGCRSAPGNGACFTLTLPCSNQNALSLSAGAAATEKSHEAV
ncbi:PAS domain-containing sensor histidine kinase [Methylomonas sp. DH-1]|uniref:sensor histidine kinase n=1 Tax=Methylomonas sp. (strain DH-1) TaxID=1727196 RepID=UPI0007C9668E|nr:ATP-binding protein [Methylomonas sp. DH-1]ANE56045.1 PAS domain-containing sensor histidine kinase [Methylomonas sp. DH-1]